MNLISSLSDPTLAIVFAALYATSEALSLIPAVKANGTFQLVFNIIKKLSRKN